MSTCELCGEQVPADEIMEHLRLFHPEQYGDGPGDAELIDMTGDEGLPVATITIRRRLTDDDLVDHVDAVDGDGGDLPLSEALGIMRLAEDTLIRRYMGEIQ